MKMQIKPQELSNNELIKYINSDNKLKELNIKEYELYLVRQYYTFLENDRQNKFFEPILRRENEELRFSLKMTKEGERLGIGQHKTLDQFAEKINIKGTVISSARIENVYENTQDRKKVKKAALDFIEQIIKNDKEERIRNLYIYGSNGSGKSYIASAIFNELNYKLNVLYANSSDLARELKFAPFDSLNEYIRNLKHCELLIIDDFGSEKMTSFYRDECLLPIIENRTINNRPMIFISNYSKKALYEAIDTKNGHDERVEKLRIMRRLNDYFNFYKMEV